MCEINKKRRSTLRCPQWQSFINLDLVPPGEAYAAGKEHRRTRFIPGAIFMVSNKRKSAAGKLYPNLVAAAGVQTDADQGGFPLAQALKFQPCFFDAFAFPLYNEYLVFGAVFPQKVSPVSAFWRRSVNHGYIFFDHGSFLYGPGED